jgi:hypothetical protein
MRARWQTAGVFLAYMQVAKGNSQVIVEIQSGQQPSLADFGDRSAGFEALEPLQARHLPPGRAIAAQRVASVHAEGVRELGSGFEGDGDG